MELGFRYLSLIGPGLVKPNISTTGKCPMLVCKSPRPGSGSHFSVHLTAHPRALLSIFWVVPSQKCRTLALNSPIQYDQMVTGTRRLSVTPVSEAVLLEQAGSGEEQRNSV